MNFFRDWSIIDLQFNESKVDRKYHPDVPSYVIDPWYPLREWRRNDLWISRNITNSNNRVRGTNAVENSVKDLSDNRKILISLITVYRVVFRPLQPSSPIKKKQTSMV